MQIEICVQSYFYQIRFCWMLSSIVQQKDHNLDIVVTCSYLKDGSDGQPNNIQIIDFFQNKGLNIIGYEYPQNKMLDRTYLRNDRAKNTKADWILFADCDMIYDPLFFTDLEKKLMSDEYKNITKVFGADRVSLDIDLCEKFLLDYQFIDPFFITQPAEQIKDFPYFNKGGRSRAAGYFQLVNGDAIRNLGKYSVKNNGFRGDGSIRYLSGGVVGLDLKPQYHLNHHRNDRYGAKFQK